MWEQIRSNRIRSVVLMAGMAVVLLLVGYFIGLFFSSPIAGLVIALVIWGIMALIGYFQGDSIILGVSGARKISREDNPRLYNVVEEMKIASGLPRMPDIYIIDDPTLNAFATGRDPNRASVAITSGLLQKLDRAELQGVIAHEMSHVKNRDVLLMSLCAVMLGTIVILAWYASRIIFFSGVSGGRRRSGGGGGGGGAQVIILAVGLVLMILAPIFAQMIYFAVSRRREYLADASGALYTRYPEGLASALEKIAASTGELKTANQAFAPMYISNPFRKDRMNASDLFSTHPPINERIRILRSMAGGASLADYDKAFRAVRKSGGVIPASALSAAPAVQAQATPATGAEPDKLERTRDTSHMLWNLAGFRLITCQCGTRLRVPPDYQDNTIACPHCGRVNQVPPQ